MGTNTVTTPRSVERLVQGQATSDGAGVRMTRLLAQDLQRRLDPFLMLDLFGTDNPGDWSLDARNERLAAPEARRA
jgi:redox-sensitive bicupin YhaK (pirin superfamily)